jgi:hypothetical protein
MTPYWFGNGFFGSYFKQTNRKWFKSNTNLFKHIFTDEISTLEMEFNQELVIIDVENDENVDTGLHKLAAVM